MQSREIEHAFSTAGFRYDRSFNSIDFAWDYGFDQVNGAKVEAFEDRKADDGSAVPQYGLTESMFALVVQHDNAERIRQRINTGGAQIAEFTITTQFDTYVGFRAFNLHHETPDAPVFRLLDSPSNPTPWRVQFYTPEFTDWLTQNFDTRGIDIEAVDIDEKYDDPHG